MSQMVACTMQSRDATRPPSAEYPIRAITYTEHDSADHPTLVLVHGMEEGCDVWGPLARRMTTAMPKVALDLPWSGRCGYEWTLAACQAGEWIEQGLSLVSAKNLILVGHSYGAMAVLDYLDRSGGDAVRAAILISPFYLENASRFDWDLFTRYAESFPRFLEEAVNVRWGPRRGDDDLKRAAAEIVRQKIGPLGCLEFIRLYSRTPALHLDRVGCPTLVVAGGRDSFATSTEGELLSRALPNASVVVLPHCGHFSMIEDSASLARETEHFLTRTLAANLGKKEQLR